MGSLCTKETNTKKPQAANQKTTSTTPTPTPTTNNNKNNNKKINAQSSFTSGSPKDKTPSSHGLSVGSSKESNKSKETDKKTTTSTITTHTTTNNNNNNNNQADADKKKGEEMQKQRRKEAEEEERAAATRLQQRKEKEEKEAALLKAQQKKKKEEEEEEAKKKAAAEVAAAAKAAVEEKRRKQKEREEHEKAATAAAAAAEEEEERRQRTQKEEEEETTRKEMKSQLVKQLKNAEEKAKRKKEEEEEKEKAATAARRKQKEQAESKKKKEQAAKETAIPPKRQPQEKKTVSTTTTAAEKPKAASPSGGVVSVRKTDRDPQTQKNSPLASTTITMTTMQTTSERSAHFAGIAFNPFTFADSTPSSSPNKYNQRQKKFWPHTQQYIASLEKPAQLKLDPLLYDQCVRFMKPQKGAAAAAATPTDGVVVTHKGAPVLELNGSLPMNMLDVIDRSFGHPIVPQQQQQHTPLLAKDRNGHPSHLVLERTRGIELLVFTHIRAQYVAQQRLAEFPPDMQQRLEAYERYYADLPRHTRDHWAVYQPHLELLLTNSVLLTKAAVTVDVQQTHPWEFIGGLRWAEVVEMGGYLWALAGVLNHPLFPYDMVMVIESAPAKKQSTARQEKGEGEGEEEEEMEPPVLLVYAADSTGSFSSAEYQKEGRAQYELALAAYEARVQDYTEDITASGLKSARQSSEGRGGVTAEQIKAESKGTQEKTAAFAKAHMPDVANYTYLHLLRENSK